MAGGSWQLAADGANQCAKSKVNKCSSYPQRERSTDGSRCRKWRLQQPSRGCHLTLVCLSQWQHTHAHTHTRARTQTQTPTCCHTHRQETLTRFHFYFYFYFQLALHRQRAINGNVSHYSTWLRDLNAMAALPAANAGAGLFRVCRVAGLPGCHQATLPTMLGVLPVCGLSVLTLTLLWACFWPRHKTAPHYLMNGKVQHLPF